MFRTDNPGGRWLEEKQKRAGEGHAPHAKGLRAKALGGAVTAWTARPIMVPTAVLARVGGVNNEARCPGDHQYDRLSAAVAENGWDPEQDGNAVLVGVNQFGEAYLIEGNTRVAFAAAHGIGEVRAEVRWFNGGEEAPGAWRLDGGRVAALEAEDAGMRP